MNTERVDVECGGNKGMRGGCACKYSEGIKVTGALDAIEGMDRDGGRLFVMNAFGIAGNASMGVYK